MARRERHRLRDVDGALHGAFHRCKADLVPCGEFGGHDPRVGDVPSVPLAKVRVGLGVGFVRGDVPDHNEVGRVGAEVRLVVVHQILAADVFEGLLGHHLTVGVEVAEIGGSNKVACNLPR